MPTAIYSSTPETAPDSPKKSLKKSLSFSPALKSRALSLLSGTDPTAENRTPNYLALVLILFFVLALIVLAITLYPRLRPNPYGDTVSIPNLTSELPDLSLKKQDLIKHNLYTTLLKQTDSTSLSRKQKQGTVRSHPKESSYNDLTTVHSGSFIVDFPALSLSYRITFEYAKTPTGKHFTGGYDTIISCLTNPSEIIYPTQTCTVSSPIDAPTPLQSLYSSLPYLGTIDSGQDFYIFSRHYSTGEPYLEVAVNSCGDPAILSAARSAAESYLTSLGLEKDTLPLELPTTYCPGGSH